MKKRASFLLGSMLSSMVGALALLGLPYTTYAAAGDLELVPASVKFSVDHPTEGRKTRIYATVKNNSIDDLYGIVRFIDVGQGVQVGTDQPISAFSGRTDDVFVDWTPSAGEHNIKVSLVPWQKGDNTSNNSTFLHVVVIADMDADGIADEEDQDIDGDGVPNNLDAFTRNPKESKDNDGDGIGDNGDTDDDNDGVPDTEDAFPLDPKETKDTDHDGIGDNADTDIDGDTIVNTEETKIGTDPKQMDTDHDSVPDNKDAFPLDPKETRDTNHNGIGDNKDPDIDGDGIPNEKDAFPNNISPKVTALDTPWIVSVKDLLRLDATSSLDPDGKVVKVEWVVDGKVKYEGVKQDIKLETTGSHEIELRITDNKGETTSKKWNVYGTTSILLTQSGIPAVLIALALLGLFYYITRASKRRAKLKQRQDHE